MNQTFSIVLVVLTITAATLCYNRTTLAEQYLCKGEDGVYRTTTEPCPKEPEEDNTVLPKSRTLVEDIPHSGGRDNSCSYLEYVRAKLIDIDKKIKFNDVDNCYRSSIPGDGREIVCEKLRQRRDDAIFEREQLIALAQTVAANCNNRQIEPPKERYLCNVTRVVDGDTFDCRFEDEAIYRIRLAGIDTPEIETYWGKKAKDYLVQLLKNSIQVEVELTRDRVDKYDRLLANIYLQDGTFLNELLVIAGYAVQVNY